jgi:hypothetical protein
MAHTRQSSNKRPRLPVDPTLARPLAPEDVRPGEYVAVLHVICELPSFLWAADAYAVPLDQPIRIPFVPPGGGVALRVTSVCLPFVLVKSARGARRTLDLRQCRLARLDRRFATATWKAYRRCRVRKRQRQA